MSRLKFSIAKNAFANVVRGGAGASVAFILPPILTRRMDQEHFAAWVLLLQIAAYINFLDFGIQTAIARFVAQTLERGNVKERDGYINSAFVLLSCAALIAFLVICLMACLIPSLFKQAPLRLLPEMRIGLVMLAGFAALALPFSTFTGVFVGLGKNEYPAVVIGTCKLAGAGLVILAVQQGYSLAVLATAIGAMNLLAGIWQYSHLRRMLPDLRLSPLLVTQSCLRTLLHFCAGLSVWSFAGFLVGGLDLTIVGYFDFRSVGSYSLASNAVLLVAGSCSAATSALIAPAAAIHARGDYERLGSLVVRATRYMTWLLTIASLPFFLLGVRLLTLWVGPIYAHASLYILQILLIGNAIRMLGAPYSAAQVAAGEHVRIMYSPLVEGVVNLIFSIVACRSWGPIGVAFGTVVGGIAGNGLQIFYNLPRIKDIQLSRRSLLFDGMVIPFACLLPGLGGLSALTLLQSVDLALRLSLAVIGAIASAVMIGTNRSTRRDTRL